MNSREIKNNLRLINDSWQVVENKLRININFLNFNSAFNFMKEIAKISEELNHHPQWTNNYNKLEIILWTHDKQALTSLDFTLAKRIDEILLKFKKV
ncbi:MAG: 4a-hydroxytetrahydrobiopterin dehydratase [Bacteroidetes bacterium]|jgi:4a-hydroxytetrahydrobiopterin dehydratase|nr:4a-hydroxytetrahydrobiopterin dehydratase [Bacteroidota bacterium]MDA1019071.1 4a-hydroxytetrahydrobiopterin dehydratase [Bacteroidota bacterium]|tara:strand:- start:25688 stop:25978 length:291 start_codon:yes stop_codon:yes gene_type:complete